MSGILWTIEFQNKQNILALLYGALLLLGAFNRLQSTALRSQNTFLTTTAKKEKLTYLLDLSQSDPVLPSSETRI
eukprot:127097-Amphidinium_carterae.1